MHAEQLKNFAVEALDDLKGKEIEVLDVRGNSTVTDFMVMASGSSDRQVKGLANHLIHKAKEQGIRPLGIEGERIGEWILVDLGDVVVHVMQPHIRAFYNLETLWGNNNRSRGEYSDKPRPLGQGN
ncbi:Ribosomal silencing factor RsfS [Gammaproteobacteria bacterium]